MEGREPRRLANRPFSSEGAALLGIDGDPPSPPSKIGPCTDRSCCHRHRPRDEELPVSPRSSIPLERLVKTVSSEPWAGNGFGPTRALNGSSIEPS